MLCRSLHFDDFSSTTITTAKVTTSTMLAPTTDDKEFDMPVREEDEKWWNTCTLNTYFSLEYLAADFDFVSNSYASI